MINTDWQEYINLLTKRASLKREQKTLNDLDNSRFLDLSLKLEINLHYNFRNKFIELFTWFLNNATDENANIFVDNFSFLYYKATQPVVNLTPEIESEKLKKLKEFFKPVNEQMEAFSNLLLIVSGACEMYNPLLHQEDDCFLTTEQLISSIESALDECRKLFKEEN
jgi:hypothetical protein